MCKTITALVMAAIVMALIAGIGSTTTRRLADTALNEADISAGVGAACMGITVLIGAITVLTVAASHHTKVEERNMKKFHDIVDGKGM